MKKILFVTKKTYLLPVDYSRMSSAYREEIGGNAGNRLFLRSVEQYLTKKDIHFDYDDASLSVNEINERYDAVVFALANIFGPHCLEEMKFYTEQISAYNIPVYVLGAGAQAASYEKLGELCFNIRAVASKFIAAVYDSGGAWGLRGYFTQQVFDKLGFKDAEVIGCPSFYRNGRDLLLSNDKVSLDIFKPLINGNIYETLAESRSVAFFKQYPESVFMDQDEFYEILYTKLIDSVTPLVMADLVKRYTLCGMHLLAQDRIRLIYDIQGWDNYLQKERFNFSFGRRIHGNILSMTNQIPSVVHVCDSRTRELAEFFNIPAIDQIPENKSLYEIYCDADYTQFNKTFSGRFDAFQNFLKKHNISSDIEDKSLFLEKKSCEHYQVPIICNQKIIQEGFCMVKKSWIQLLFYKCIYKLSIRNFRQKNKACYRFYKKLSLECREIEKQRK